MSAQKAGTSRTDEMAQEIARLNKIIAVLIEHSESLDEHEDSAFGIFQKTALLETEVNNRTRALNKAVSDLEALNKNLTMTQAKFQILFDLLPNPALVSRLDNGELADVNNRFCEVFGFEKRAILGKVAGSAGIGWWPTDADRAAFVERLEKAGGVLHGFECGLRNSAGAIRNFILSGRTLSIAGESLLVIECQDIGDYAHRLSVLRDLAERDALTGLPNRLLIQDRMQQAMNLMRRNGQKMAVAYLDLDGFKGINDLYGHNAGDLVLVETAARLLASVRNSDTVGRLGGDEFVVLLLEPADSPACEGVFARILAAVNKPFRLPEAPECQVGISIGYTIFPEDDATLLELLEHADQALYAAKRDGKNRFEKYGAMAEPETATKRARIAAK